MRTAEGLHGTPSADIAYGCIGNGGRKLLHHLWARGNQQARDNQESFRHQRPAFVNNRLPALGSAGRECDPVRREEACLVLTDLDHPTSHPSGNPSGTATRCHQSAAGGMG